MSAIMPQRRSLIALSLIQGSYPEVVVLELRAVQRQLLCGAFFLAR